MDDTGSSIAVILSLAILVIHLAIIRLLPLLSLSLLGSTPLLGRLLHDEGFGSRLRRRAHIRTLTILIILSLVIVGLAIVAIGLVTILNFGIVHLLIVVDWNRSLILIALCHIFIFLLRDVLHLDVDHALLGVPLHLNLETEDARRDLDRQVLGLALGENFVALELDGRLLLFLLLSLLLSLLSLLGCLIGEVLLQVLLDLEILGGGPLVLGALVSLRRGRLLS